MDVLEFPIVIGDESSAPAKKAAAGLDMLHMTLEGTEKALKSLEKAQRRAAIEMEKDPTKRHKMSLEHHKLALLDQIPANQKLQGSMAGYAVETGVITAVATKAIESLQALASAAYHVGVEFAKTVLETSEFKTAMVGSLEVFEGSEKAAKEMVGTLQGMGIAVGASADKTTELYRGLRGAGFAAKEAQDILSAGFDVGAQMGGGEKGMQTTEKLLGLMTKVRTMGKLDSRAMTSLAGDVGISPEAVYKEIAKIKGITDKGAKDLVDSGALTASAANDAILNAVSTSLDKGGALGGHAIELGKKSLGAQKQAFGDLWSNTFEDVDISPLANIMSKVNGLFAGDSPTGKRITAFFSETLGGAFKQLDEWITTGKLEAGFSILMDGVDLAKKAFLAAWPYVEKFGGALIEKIVPALEQTGAMFDRVFPEGKNRGPSPETLAALDLYAGVVVKGVTGSLDLLLALYAIGEYFPSMAKSITNSLLSLDLGVYGKAMVDGLWNGITFGWGDLIKNFDLLVGELPLSVRKVLNIHSPSKVMMELGEYTTEGFNQGLGNGGAQESLNDLVSAPATSGIGIQGNGGGGGVSITVGDIVIHGTDAGTAARVGQEVRESIHRELIAELEQAGLTI